MKSQILKSAWLLTWEGTQGPGLDDNTKIAGLISGRRGKSFVGHFARLLFCSSRYSVTELIGETKRPDQSLDVPNNGSMSVWIGYNPFIFARLVRNFHVKQNSEGNEILGWIDPLTYRIDKVTFAPKIESGEVERSLVRQSLPLLNVA